ncbi:hypothetical protein F4775DRAFT_602850 [Biscogniauxia sp. FL1348]|nr:hypothetical protein F4775DRAFT_602850 [Biscogniauxia sp. FL1348]
MRTSIVIILSSALGLASVASCREHKWTRDVDRPCGAIYPTIAQCAQTGCPGVCAYTSAPSSPSTVAVCECNSHDKRGDDNDSDSGSSSDEEKNNTNNNTNNNNNNNKDKDKDKDDESSSGSSSISDAGNALSLISTVAKNLPKVIGKIPIPIPIRV